MPSSSASSVAVGARPSRCDKSAVAAAEPQVQFLQAPRHLDRPAVVAEVPADLAHDGGHREGDEIRTGFDVEADDGVDQSDARDLNQVVARFTAALEPPGDVIGQRQAPLHNLVAMARELH